MTPERALVATTSDDDEAEGWLVLAALGIPHEVVPAAGELQLWVPAADAERAREALARAARERAEPPLGAVPPTPDQGRSTAGLAVVIVLGAFYWVTHGRGAGDPGGWFRAGAADAARILAGEWWRAVTMLTLHADVMHVLGNAVAALIFVGALGRWVGSGLALLLTLASGAFGNALVALAHRHDHVSVGASTATFGAFGALGGLQLVRWLRGRPGLPGFVRRRQALAVLAACLGVFAMLGVGERSDVLAHLFGLLVGLLLGVVTGRLVRAPLPFVAQTALGAGAAAALALAWILARA